MIAIFLLYISCSALGLTLIKMGINQGTLLKMSEGMLQIHVGLLLVVGAVLYVASFLLSMAAMSKMNLTVFYPISAGLIYVVVCLLGIFLLKENISLTQSIGMGIILLGIVVMNLHKA